MAGSDAPQEALMLDDVKDFSQVRFMESYESRHSDFDFTAKLAASLGVTRQPLRIDSQAKYGAFPAQSGLSYLSHYNNGYAALQKLVGCSSHCPMHY